jgi:fatty-acyl-CoA synthase
MLGLMQDWPLTVDRIIDHAARTAGHREIVTRSVEGPIVRTTYAEIRTRAKRLSNALLAMGISRGDRVATLAWNTGRHLESWYGVMGIGAVCHTLNPRLFGEQLAWIINHAGDRVILADACFAPLLSQVLPGCPAVEHLVFYAEPGGMPAEGPAGALCYEELIAAHPAQAPWGGFDENSACGLCYTSGTTGNPKGVLYSHRSNFLHTLTTIQPDIMNLGVGAVVLPVVPMFHANAWGLAFSCPAVGCKMVLPGPRLDGASVLELIQSEGVTFSAAVPTVWLGLLQHLRATGEKVPTLERVVIGGAACPESIIRAFHDDYGVEVVHAWGMTETSPLGTTAALTPEVAALPFDRQMATRLKQGRPPVGVELKIADDTGAAQPADGRSVGRLMVRGPFIAGGYFRGDGDDILDDEGFFDTGDVAHLDRDGYIQITDRAKDVIKSGGEWISSIEIENLAVCHPKAELCAVVGIPHEKWNERPILLVKLKDGDTATAREFLDHLEGRIARWWMPDAVHFVADIPLGATGKIDKKRIRAELEQMLAGSVEPAV